MAKESWKYTDQTGGGVSSTVREIEVLYELGQLARVKPPHTFIEFGISPLTYNADTLDLVYRMRGRPQMSAMAIDPGPIPTLGGTGPLSLRAVLAQSVAETLGGSVLVDLLTNGEQLPLCTGMTAVGVDMRFGTVNFSSPESILLLQMGFEVGSYVTGVPSVGGAMRTIGKGCDEQAAAEKMMCALVGALSGARHFCDLGQISVDDAFSYEQVVLDLEMLASVERFVNGFDFDRGADTLDLMREGLEPRNFFGSAATLENFRADYWCPEIFERRMLGSWQADGGPLVVDKARAVAKAAIAAVIPRLDESTAAKMDELVRKYAGSL
jgi:trimethylamine--corrinoid protein Co-methyltransferase